MESKLGSGLAWLCYRAQAFDLACDLFLCFLEANLANFKYLNTLEAAANKCGRLGELIESYEKFVSVAPKLHGRIRTLKKRLGTTEPPA